MSKSLKSEWYCGNMVLDRMEAVGEHVCIVGGPPENTRISFGLDFFRERTLKEVVAALQEIDEQMDGAVFDGIDYDGRMNIHGMDKQASDVKKEEESW